MRSRGEKTFLPSTCLQDKTFQIVAFRERQKPRVVKPVGVSFQDCKRSLVLTPCF